MENYANLHNAKHTDSIECCLPEDNGVSPAKPQNQRLCDVHTLRAHHWNNVFKQGGGGRSADNLNTHNVTILLLHAHKLFHHEPLKCCNRRVLSVQLFWTFES